MRVGKAVSKTIAYVKKYGGILTTEEVYDRLISPAIFSKIEVQRVAAIAGIKNTSKNNRLEVKKRTAAKRLAGRIAKNDNDIIFVGLTGSVAAGNCKKGDDIDLMVVTGENCLWKSRLKLKLFLRKNEVVTRKYGEAQKKDTFCFNMWLDKGRLKLPKEKQTLKSAVDLVLVKPLFDRGRVYEEFIKVNKWAKKWVATPYNNLKFLKKKAEKKSEGVGGSAVNLMAFAAQYLYMWPRIEMEKVGLKSAFFHRD